MAPILLTENINIRPVMEQVIEKLLLFALMCLSQTLSFKILAGVHQVGLPSQLSITKTGQPQLSNGFPSKGSRLSGDFIIKLVVYHIGNSSILVYSITVLC